MDEHLQLYIEVSLDMIHRAQPTFVYIKRLFVYIYICNCLFIIKASIFNRIYTLLALNCIRSYMRIYLLYL